LENAQQVKSFKQHLNEIAILAAAIAAAQLAPHLLRKVKPQPQQPLKKIVKSKSIKPTSQKVEPKKLNDVCKLVSATVWDDLLQKTPLCNIKGNAFWKGQVQSSPICNLKDSVVWKGITQETPIANIKGDVLWEGNVQETPLCNIKNNVVWEGITQTKPLCNFTNQPTDKKSKTGCLLTNLVMWLGNVKSEPVLNTRSYPNKNQRLVLAYLFVVKTKKAPRKEPDSSDKPVTAQASKA
jgi:hypothetical protein